VLSDRFPLPSLAAYGRWYAFAKDRWMTATAALLPPAQIDSDDDLQRP